MGLKVEGAGMRDTWESRLFGTWGRGLVTAGSTVIAVVGFLGCVPQIPTNFLPTEASFAMSPSGRPPEVYMDRRPSASYRAVGIIEVIGGDNVTAVVYAAMKKGQEVGCDLVLDRALHVVSHGPSMSRWTAIVEEEERGPRGTIDHPARVAAGALLGDSFPTYTPPVIMPFPVAPQPHREFICGVYEKTIAANQAQAEVAHKAILSAPLESIWDVWTKANLADSCSVARKVLPDDSECSGPSCRADLVLSSGFIKHCSPDGDTLRSIYQLRHRWEKEASGDRVTQCFEELTALMRDPGLAVSAPPACGGETVVERTLRDAARRAGAGSK